MCYRIGYRSGHLDRCSVYSTVTFSISFAVGAGAALSRWFWFGLLTSSGYLLSNHLLRMVLHPSAAATLAALAGTSLALVLIRFQIGPTTACEPRPLSVPAPRRRRLERPDLTPPPIGLGLAGTPELPSAAPTAARDRRGLLEELMPLGFHPAVDEFKRRLLCQTIQSCGGDRAEAARRLGLQRTYLHRLTKQLNCGEPRPDDEGRPST